MKISTIVVLGATILGVSLLENDRPLKAEQKVNVDQVYAKIQKICPVSGQNLGSHGTPYKASVGKEKEQVFLCCKGCVGQNIDRKHWNQIHVNLIAAQKKCPVMNKPLPKNPSKTIANGLPIYTCCPPCGKKITNDPKTYVSKVNTLYAKSLKDHSKQ